MKKRFLSALLALCMALTLLPSVALALEAFTVNTETGLAAAITNVAGNGTIKLIGNIDLGVTFNLSGGKSFTIDLNGYTLTSSSDRGVFEVNSGTLTIADSSDAKTGKITSTKGYENFGTINVNGGSFVVDSGMVENRNTNVSVHTIAVTAGNVTVNDGKVERNNESGCSIYNTGSGTICVNGGAVSGGSIAIYNTNGTVTVAGGEVSNNSFNTAIYSTGTVNVTGGTVKNTSGLTSCAISSNDGSVNIGGGEVIGFNGVNNDSGTVNVTDGTITGSSNYAIFSIDDGSISVSGGQLNSKLSAIYYNGMSDCDIDVTGGALYSDDFFAIFNCGSGDLNVAGTARVEGKTTASGGAIYYTSYGAFTIGGTAVITSPRSSDTGGTIYVGNNSALNITGGTIENTYAGATGNAIFATNPTGGVSIASTSTVIIKGPGAAMTSAPYLTNTVVKTAATNINGTDGIVAYNPDNISTYKYLKFETAAVSIGGTGYASLQDAVDAVDAGQTIKLLKDTSENIYIPDTFTCSFTIDLNGFTLSSTSGLAMEYKGAGILTITDNSSAGGGTTTASSNVIESNGNGKIRVSGKATISSTGFYAISITGGSTGDDVLEITGGTVQSSSNCAIKNEGDGNVTVSGGSITGSTGIESRYHVGDIIVSGGTITGSSNGIYTAGNVTLTGGMVENTGSDAAIYCSSKQIIIPSGTVVVKGGGIAMNKQPVLTDYTSYQWRISSSAAFMPSTQAPYVWSAGDTYLEVQPTYSVTYRPGANGTGSVAVDAKTIDVALTLRGAIFTRNGFTQTGWAITDSGTIAFDLGGSYTANEPITLYPVWTQNPPAPSGSGGGTTPPATVYNDPNKTSATIWLSGSGLRGNDILVTETITGGSSYNAMLKLANSGDILHVYDISLQSGSSSTGSAMYLTFDLTGQYAGEEFTLVHKKADGTFEYLYATAGADGKVKFGPVYELSPFMLAKGSLLQIPSYAVVDVPKTGDSAGPLCLVLLLLAGACGVGAVIYRKKQA